MGAGRKPGRRNKVVGMDGARFRSGAAPVALPLESGTLREPPADLELVAQGYWRAWADEAIRERTLTPATVAGFTELCRRMANVRAMDDRIAVLGIATQDALPYLKERRGQAAQLAASLKDFKLTAFGKPATPDTPKKPINPFAAVAG